MSVTVKPKANKSNLFSVSNPQNSGSGKLGKVKEDLDKYFQEKSTFDHASSIGVSYIDLYGFPISSRDIVLIPKEMVERTQTGCFRIDAKKAYIASVNPEFNEVKEVLEYVKSKGYTPILHACSRDSIEKLLRSYQTVVKVEKVSDGIEINENRISKLVNAKTDSESLMVNLQSHSTSEVFETILILAIKNKASDIHFEPERDGYKIKLRIDGVLHSFGGVDEEIKKRLESRVKLISGAKLNVDNVPQDGRMSFHVDEKEIDVRVSMLPSEFGYSIVMRLLGNDDIKLNIEALGFHEIVKPQIYRQLDKPQGLILVTGPTGSGKTTTLYSFLNHLNNGERKIITIEDPVEYKLDGISQTQIDPENGYDFAGALKSILRQDPDVVMVGEIRDEETAKIAVEASLTGHLVLSTLHTNNSVGAISRMLEMGIKGYLLADAISMIIGQRLIRKLCPACKKPDQLDPLDQQNFISSLKSLPKIYKKTLPQQVNLVTSEGCPECNKVAYKGRTGAYETLLPNYDLKQLISDPNPNMQDIRKMATEFGTVTMIQDGFLKAIKGETDVKEILRVIT